MKKEVAKQRWFIFSVLYNTDDPGFDTCTHGVSNDKFPTMAEFIETAKENMKKRNPRNISITGITEVSKADFDMFWSSEGYKTDSNE